MKSWVLTEADIDRIALGVGILGTGGGGSPYLAMLMVKAQLRQGRTIRVIRPCDLAPDALVQALGGIGAPTVGIEKIEEGDEGVRALKAMEAQLGRKIDAVIADEIGGGNGLAPMTTAAKLGLPVVDADGMGRAFPEVQMTTFFIHGQVVEGADSITWFAASGFAQRGFCSTCGSLLFWKPNDAPRYAVLAGAFDRPEALHPGYHICTDGRPEFYRIGDGLPQYPGDGPDLVTAAG